MPLMPKRVKFRKSQRGKVRGSASRGNYVSFGEYGLQSLESGWLSAESIEAGRITAAHTIRGEGRLYIRVFPHNSVTAILGVRHQGGDDPVRGGGPARGGGPGLPGARGVQDAVQVPVRGAAAEYLVGEW